MENYPIIIKNETAGQLSVYNEGAKTCFTADCKMQNGIVRLSVFGEGKMGYLGVLAPKGDRLYLRKSFSRSEMKEFPQKIEYAAPHNEAPRKVKKKEAADEVLWEKSCDGALYFMDGARSLVALPSDDKRLVGQRHELRMIDGKEYAVLSPETYRIVK